jgi:hypothetical protein
MKQIMLLIWLTATFVFAFLYLKYDRKSYDYGYGCSLCNKKLPYNLKPHDGKEFSFTLNGDDGFELVGIGFRYRQSSFKIKIFLAYGYNDTSVIAKVTDSLNNIKYLMSYETGYKSKKGNPEISFRDIDDNYFEQVKENYKWVEIDEEKANTARFIKFISLVGAVVSVVFLIAIILRPIKAAQ